MTAAIHTSTGPHGFRDGVRDGLRVGPGAHHRPPLSAHGRRTTRARRPPSAATFRRRRLTLGLTSAILVAVGAVSAHDVLAGSGGVPASAAASRPAHVRTVVARPGDTLWSLAAAHRGDVGLVRYVDALVEVNGGASIQAGQAVVLP